MPYIAQPYALAQDRTGFIWIGTTGGLARWDGYRVSTYGGQAGNSCALRDERVGSLFVDERARLWIGTLGGDIAHYDPQTDCIVTVKGASDALNGAGVGAMASDGGGGLWIGSFTGLVHLDADLTHIIRLSEDASEGGRVSHGHITRVLRDRAGALWVGGDFGLARRGPAEAHFVAIALPLYARVQALMESSDRRIWVGTGSHGAYVVDPSTMAVREIPAPLGRDPILYLRNAAETASGEIWFGAPNSGIVAVDPVSLRTRLIHHERGVAFSLVDDTVLDLMRDRSGLIWVATGNSVGYYNTKSDIGTILIADELNGLSEGEVEAMARMSDERIAIGFRDQVALIGPRGIGAERVTLDLQPAVQEVISLATLNGRDLFAVTIPNGLVWIDRLAGRVYPVPLPAPLVAHPRTLLADGDRLWVGGREGLWLLTRRTDGAAASTPWSVEQRFDVGEVGPGDPLAAGAGEVRWFGTTRGLYRYDGNSGTPPRHVNLLSSSGAMLPDFIVTSVHADRRGRVWVGSNSQGLLVFDPSVESAHGISVLRHFLRDLPAGSIDKILEDGSGAVWVAADRGIARIDAESFAVRLLTRGDGQAVSNFSTGICGTQACNEMLFGGQDGITVIYPNRPKPSQLPPPIVITRISVGHQEVASARFNSTGTEQLLDVPADARDLALEFSALDYSDPMSNVYEYQLKDYDSDWVRTGFDSRMAAYTNPAPGTYRMRVRGTDHAGVWSVNERQLIVRVAATWYQTMAFHLLEAGCVLAAVFLIVQARTRILRQRQRELELIINQRTQALVRATETRNSLIENLAHDLRTPLTSLRGYLDRLNLNDPALSEIERGRYIGIAVRQAERLIRLVRELFELVRLDDPQAKLTLESFSPAEILQDVAQEFGSIAEGRSIEVDIEPGAESMQIIGDISLFQRLIDNLVDNAMRHTPSGGKITVKLGTDAGVMLLEVSDTGCGIEGADRDRIFNRYERIDAKAGASGAGLGLAIVKRILELYGGNIVLDSDVGAGARFKVRLPLTRPVSDSGT